MSLICAANWAIIRKSPATSIPSGSRAISSKCTRESLRVDTGHWIPGSERGDGLANADVQMGILHVRDDVRDPIPHLSHFLFLHPARGERRGAQTNPTGHRR